MSTVPNSIQNPPTRIKSVSIEGFRSLRSIKDLNLSQLTVLIGANGAGKSNLIRFFELLSWMLRSQELQQFIQNQGGGDDQFFMGARTTPRIRAQLALETNAGVNEYLFYLNHLSAGDTVLVTDEAYRYSAKAKGGTGNWHELSHVGKEAGLLDVKHTTAKTIRNLLCQCSTYQFHDTSAGSPIRLKWDTSDSIRLRSHGGNLAAVLLDLLENDPQRLKLIVRQIQRVLLGFHRFVLEPVAGKVELRWQGKMSEKIFGAHLTSDGSLRLFCLLTLLNLPQSRLPAVMFLDEPELGLHPHAITLVAEMIKRLSKTIQVFVATQSPYLVDCFELDNIIVAEGKDGETKLRNLSSRDYREWLDDGYLPSDIWLKTPAGGWA